MCSSLAIARRSDRLHDGMMVTASLGDRSLRTFSTGHRWPYPMRVTRRQLRLGTMPFRTLMKRDLITSHYLSTLSCTLIAPISRFLTIQLQAWVNRIFDQGTPGSLGLEVALSKFLFHTAITDDNLLLTDNT